MHSEFLNVEDDKMAKSKNNFYTLRDIEAKGFSGLDLRYLYLQSNYRTQQNFSWDSLAGSKSALHKLNTSAQQDDSDTEPTEPFSSAINNDLNTAQALATVWEQKNNFTKYDEVLGLKLSEAETAIEVPTEVQALLDARQTARDSKDFAKSDALRDEIEKLGFEVKDTGEGQEVNKV